jgi:4-hydroxybenzoate polyprenyltransferase
MKDTMENKDERLWRIAKKRADFKKSVFSYLVVVPFLWGIWWITRGHDARFDVTSWPVYVTLGWGLGLAFQFYNAYGAGSQDMVEKEYEKLKREQQN